MAWTYDGIEYAFTEVVVTTSPKIPMLACHRKKGILYINPNFWNRLNRCTRRFVLCHEEAHYLYDISDEIDTDEKAFERYTESGAPLTAAVRAVWDNLNEDIPEHYMRMVLQLNRALEYDYTVNGNKKAYRGQYFTEEKARQFLNNK